jgi:hypothetical protein
MAAAASGAPSEPLKALGQAMIIFPEPLPLPSISFTLFALLFQPPAIAPVKIFPKTKGTP